MHVRLDGVIMDLPTPGTLAELLEGVAPHVDTDRLVTRVDVDGASIDPSESAALARRRLRGTEEVTVETEGPGDFAAARRREVPVHLGRITNVLEVATRGFAAGQEADAYRCLALASQELALVIELDQSLACLDDVPSRCADVLATVRRIGPRLEAATRACRGAEVAALLADEMLPALRAALRTPTAAADDVPG